MNYDYKLGSFSKALLAGLFAGIAATCISLVFNAYFRGIVNFDLSAIINVSTLIFSLTILLTIVGLIYNLFITKMKRGSLIFQVVSFVGIALLAFGAFHVTRTTNVAMNFKFQELLLGIIIITGMCTVFGIPYLYKKDIL